MSIALYAVQADGGKIVSLDDQLVVKDLAALDASGGTAYTCSVLSTPFDDGDTGGWASLRRMIQDVPHDGAVTVVCTPHRDGLDTGQSITRTLTSADNSTIVVPFDVKGTAFQLNVALSVFDAAAGLGIADATLIPRRSQR